MTDQKNAVFVLEENMSLFNLWTRVVISKPSRRPAFSHKSLLQFNSNSKNHTDDLKMSLIKYDTLGITAPGQAWLGLAPVHKHEPHVLSPLNEANCPNWTFRFPRCQRAALPPASAFIGYSPFKSSVYVLLYCSLPDAFPCWQMSLFKKGDVGQGAIRPRTQKSKWQK